MKIQLRFLTVALALSLAAVSVHGLPEGESAPDFVATRLDGSAFESTELAGKVTLIDFWGTWCPPCIGAFPKLSRLHDDYGARGFQVLGLAVLSGTPEEVTEFISEYEVTYPNVVIELDVAEAFDVLQYPSYFLVDADGTVVRNYQSRPGDLYGEVARDLDELLPEIPTER